MKPVYTIIFCLAILLGLPEAHCAGSKRALNEIDVYLSSLDSVRMQFLQFDSNLEEKRGVLYIKKPGKLRIEYVGDEREIIVLKKKLVMYYNSVLKETNYLPADTLVLSLLAEKRFTLAGNAQKLKISEDSKSYYATFKLADNTNRDITMIFAKHPLLLRSITFSEEGNILSVDFLKIEKLKISEEVFNFSNR